MIDKESPSEEHVGVESREVQESIASEEERSEEAQLEAIAKEEQTEESKSDVVTVASNEVIEEKVEISNGDKATEVVEVSNGVSEEVVSEDSVAKGETSLPSEKSDLTETGDLSKVDQASELSVTTEVAKLDEQPTDKEELKTDSDVNKSSEVDTSRGVASEEPVEEVNPPSQVEPTIGVPNRLKNTDDKVPSQKPTDKKGSSNKRKETRLAMSVDMDKKASSLKEPVLEIVPQAEMLERVTPESIEPKVNALGEEEAATPQFASVEIASFVQRHWLATIMLGLLVVSTLYFFVLRKKGEDNQSI